MPQWGKSLDVRGPRVGLLRTRLGLHGFGSARAVALRAIRRTNRSFFGRGKAPRGSVTGLFEPAPGDIRSRGDFGSHRSEKYFFLDSSVNRPPSASTGPVHRGSDSSSINRRKARDQSRNGSSERGREGKNRKKLERLARSIATGRARF